MNNIELERPVFNSTRMEQQWNRMQGVKMMRSGFTAQQVADFFGVSCRAVFKWVAAFDESGQDGLLSKKGAGRPVKLSAVQLRWIAAAVRHNTPNQLRFESGLWTLRLIGELIERELGQRLSRATLGKIMTRFGFTAQRPLWRAYEQDPALVQNWLAAQLPTLRQRAKQRGARIFFANETSMPEEHGADTVWASQEKTPAAEPGGQRRPMNMISAISRMGELQFMLVEGGGTAQVFRQFLEQLMLGARQPIILVADGHSTHTAKVVNEYVASTNGMLELYNLPPYSLPLNPDQQDSVFT